ncbi:unnamed protein product [Gongylonema pulchrum]|uniref:Gamma-tubulin complex component n=1 Tax=Gongylonema pulchrum TaxID=637853 RepID=A0A183DND9_9BILA|nr:unnamed protein product [Gongylonema pulchrum]
MAAGDSGIGSVLERFMREFDCSPADRDDICTLLTHEDSRPPKIDEADEIRFIQRKIVSDEELLRNVLLALQGSEGHYFVHQSNCEHRKLCLSNAFHLDNIYRSCLLQLLTIANAYLFLQYECKKPKSDMLIRAFDTGLSEVLDRYLAKVVSFYTQITYMLSYFSIVVTAASFESENLSILLQPMLYILHECLATWLLKGKLSDFEFEWMIEKIADQWYENSWKDEYRIVSTAIPIVLELSEKIVEKILFIGKTVNLLFTLGLENDCRDEMKRIFSSVDSSKCYLDILHFDELRCAVDKLLICAKDLIARKIIKKYGVFEHIRTVQELYLLGDECFAHIFYGKLKAEVGNLGFCVLDSLRTSRAFQLAAEEYCFWPHEITEFMKIDATCGLMVKYENDDISCLIPSPRDPDSSPTIHLFALKRYQKAFAFIWLVTCTDFELTDAMHEFYSLKKDSKTDTKQILKLFSAAFSRMCDVLKELRRYICYTNTLIRLTIHLFQVTLPLQAKFSQEIDGIYGDIDAIIETLRNLFYALFTLIMELLDCWSCFRLDANDVSEARKRFNGYQKAVIVEDLQDVHYFEREEERIHLEELQQCLMDCYRPKIGMIKSKFALLMRDILKVLAKPAYSKYRLFLSVPAGSF